MTIQTESILGELERMIKEEHTTGVIILKKASPNSRELSERLTSYLDSNGFDYVVREDNEEYNIIAVSRSLGGQHG